MSYLLHSSIVNPAKPDLKVKESLDQQDTVTLDVPLLIRIMELAREDIKSDADLHNVVERILGLKDQGVLTMQNYDAIVAKQEQDPSTAELESIKKLAGI